MNHIQPRQTLSLRQWITLVSILFVGHVSLVEGFRSGISHQQGLIRPSFSSRSHTLSTPTSTSCRASKQPIHLNENNNKSNNSLLGGVEQRHSTVTRWLSTTKFLFRNPSHNNKQPNAAAAAISHRLMLSGNTNTNTNAIISRGWKSVVPSTLLTAAALFGTALLAASPAAHAAAAASITNLDLSVVSGGASALALSTSQFWDGLMETGFYQAFSLVFVSEIGDKTFFIAGLLAMKTSRLISFVGSMGALAAMTLVSVIIGQIFHAVPTGIADGIPLDDLAAVFAFTFFGIKTLKEAFAIEDGASGTMDEELAEAQETVEGSATIKQDTPWAQIASIFALVFAAEFGDRSFLSTIALSAAQNPVSVAGGAIAAHAVATGIAVSGGSFVAKMLSEKVIGLIGGTLFLVFAVTTALGIF